MIVLENLTLRYPGQPNLIENLSLTIAPGEWVTFKGPLSWGKTSLLRLLAGMEFPSSGQITWQGISLRRTGTLNRLRQCTGMIWSTPQFVERLPLHRNLALPLEIQGMARHEITPRIESALQRVGLSEQQHRFPQQLSSTDQHRLSFARAIIGRPNLLLVDELPSPTPRLTSLLQNLLDTFHQSGVTIITSSTQDQSMLLPRGREITINPVSSEVLL
ncbi:MAG: ATP-binding cassette domain-containing protein [Betaproteobacteria bacterium]|jgi:Predicted ATPase involved in cell division|nr:ATP-binding cassette domain-containing protein [Betaproteobacteria bacterium]